MHISLSDELQEQLEPFAENRQTSKSAIIRYALAKLFKEENADPASEADLATVLSRKFSIPATYTPLSFWATLYVLQDNYPKESSKKCWGEIIYLSSVDKTHREIFIEVIEERKQLEASRKNGSHK